MKHMVTPPSASSGLNRSFRRLTREEFTDPEQFDVLTSMELGGKYGWDQLVESPRVLIISAAGSGKTYECQEQARKLFASGKAAFFLTLEGISTTELRFLLKPVELSRYRQWLADGHSEAHFFLDSADELLLSHGDFRQALRKFALAIDGSLHRASIVVTSRPISLDLDAFVAELPTVPLESESETIEAPTESFRHLISGDERKERQTTRSKAQDEGDTDGVPVVGLTSLSQAQIEQFAAQCGVRNPMKLVEEIAHKRTGHFAQRPQELIEICSYWNEHAQLGTRSQQVAEDIRRKLQEAGPRKLHTTLSEAKALEGAERLALAQVLTRKRTIRFSDLSLDDIEREAAIDPSIVLNDWTESERSELLQRPLFGFASYGRVRFHHRSASEFLAAQRLHRLAHEKFMARSALFRLLFGECYGQHFIFPSMRAVAAWLAIWNNAVRDAMLEREPEALMDDGDPESFPISTRHCILAEYVRRYGQDQWRGVRIPYPQVLHFASPELSATVRALWSERSTSPEVRELLIDLVLAGRMRDCLDMALEVANDAKASSNDRVTALTALAEMTEPDGLDALMASLLRDAHWPSDVKEGVFSHLFPKHLTIPQFVELLSQITVQARVIGGVKWTLPQLVSEVDLPDGKLAEFCSSLARLLDTSTKAASSWSRFASKFSHLSPALAILCLRQFDDTKAPSSSLVEAAVIAARLSDHEYGDEKPVANLLRRLHEAPASWRKAAYLAEGNFCTTHASAKEKDESGIHIVSCDTTIASLGHEDFDWLIEIASDPTIDRRIRASAFQDAIYLLHHEGMPLQERIEVMHRLAEGEPCWLDRLDKWLAPAKPNHPYEAAEAERKKKQAEREAEKKEAIESWVTWRDEVLRDPDAYFAKSDVSVVVDDFAHVLANDPEASGWRPSWSRAMIAAHFTDQIAERVREAFSRYWRTVKVLLRSERPEDERNTVWSHWVHALAGVYAEAEVPDWAARLDRDSAELAARLATVELNGVPPWLKDLVEHQPDAVDVTLGEELSAQLADAVSFEFPDLLADFSHADHRVLEFFAPRVSDWLSTATMSFDDEKQRSRMHTHLDRAFAFVLRGGMDKHELASLAQARLAAGLHAPFALLWLMLLLSTSPQQAITLLDQQVDRLDPSARYHLSESLLAALGDQHDIHFSADLSSPEFTAEMLLSLTRLAYAEIRLVDDIDRLGGGAYRRTMRDEAQSGRSAVLNALLARTGPEAWAVKQKMRKDPLFAHFKDRLDQLAREKAAADAEGPAHADADVLQVERSGEMPPADRNGMFQLMMDRIADLRHDIAAHEFSERPILVKIDKEKHMQAWFAKRLQDRANGAYKVDREALVVNDKETDIRLLSVRSNAQAVIELKLANNDYGTLELENALRHQLLGQYMRHDHCRAGCLLITMNKVRQWHCPESGAKLDFEAVLSRLKRLAADLEVQTNHEVRLAVVGIDLT